MIRKFMVQTAAVATLSIAAVAGTSTSAFAQSGQISFTGAVNLGNFAGDLTGNTLLIDFLSPTGGFTGTLFTVAGATGVFSGIAANTSATVSDLLVTSSGATARSVPFLSVGGYTFTNPAFVNAVGGDIRFGPIKLVQDGNNTSASLALSGILAGTGITAGQRFDGVFTTQFAGITPTALFNTINEGGSIQNQGVSASFAYTLSTIPEPSTYLLMAAGLAGLGVVARRRRMTV